MTRLDMNRLLGFVPVAYSNLKKKKKKKKKRKKKKKKLGVYETKAALKEVVKNLETC